MAGSSFSSVVGEGGDFVESFRALINESGGTYVPKKLPAAKAAPEIPARVGSSAPVASPGATTSGGVASPLTEVLYSERTFWSQRVSTTPDGMFTLAWTPLKSIRFQDANFDDVVMNFKDAP